MSTNLEEANKRRRLELGSGWAGEAGWRTARPSLPRRRSAPAAEGAASIVRLSVRGTRCLARHARRQRVLPAPPRVGRRLRRGPAHPERAVASSSAAMPTSSSCCSRCCPARSTRASTPQRRRCARWPTVLFKGIIRCRRRRLRREALSARTPAARAGAHYRKASSSRRLTRPRRPTMLDDVRQRATFAYTGIADPPEATLLCAEAGQAAGTRRTVEGRCGVSFQFARGRRLRGGKEVVEPETINGFRHPNPSARCSRPRHEQLVIAGGADAAALTLGDASDERRGAAATARRATASDIDLVVADSTRRRRPYQRVLRTSLRDARQAPGFRPAVGIKPPTRSASSCSSCGRQRRSPSSPATRSATFSSPSPPGRRDVIWNFDVDACQLAYDGEGVRDARARA